MSRTTRRRSDPPTKAPARSADSGRNPDDHLDHRVYERPERAGRREWIGLAVLALPTLADLDRRVRHAARAAEHQRGLHASSTQQLWIMDVYSFMLSGFMITMGTLGDRIGRGELLMIGAAGFGIASIVAAYSTRRRC